VDPKVSGTFFPNSIVRSYSISMVVYRQALQVARARQTAQEEGGEEAISCFEQSNHLSIIAAEVVMRVLWPALGDFVKH